MTDTMAIKTKGNEVVLVTYTDHDGNTVTFDHVKNIQTYRIMSSSGSADKVQMTLVPDIVEWAIDLGLPDDEPLKLTMESDGHISKIEGAGLQEPVLTEPAHG